MKMAYSDIDPQDINPETGRPYFNYSSASLSDHPIAAHMAGGYSEGTRPDNLDEFLIFCPNTRMFLGDDESSWTVDCGQAASFTTAALAYDIGRREVPDHRTFMILAGGIHTKSGAR